IIRTAARPLIKNLDELPFPAYHLVKIEKYSPPPGLFFKKPIIGMITSRGCPYDCNFCADTIIWQGQCRMKKSQFVVDEMEYLVTKFGAKEIKFYDDTFTANRSRVVEICQEILKRKIDVLWRCGSRVDRVDLELLRLMKESGCCSITFGIESGSDEILEKMNKNITVKQIKNAVKAAKSAGIETKGYFILNYPGETIATTEQTIKLSGELNLDFAVFNLFLPYPGTKARKEVESSYQIEPKLWDKIDVSYGDQIYFYQDKLPAKYLKSAYRRAGLGFYLRPRYILKSLLRINNLEMLKSYLLGFLRLFKIGIKA
ncbi:MAG: radical SAM protein, partial [bacterium]